MRKFKQNIFLLIVLLNSYLGTKAQSSWVVNSANSIRIEPEAWWDTDLRLTAPEVNYTWVPTLSRYSLRMFGSNNQSESFLQIRTKHLNLPTLTVGSEEFPSSFDIKTCESETVKNWQVASAFEHANQLEVAGTLTLGVPENVVAGCMVIAKNETNLTIKAHEIIINQPMSTNYYSFSQQGIISFQADAVHVNPNNYILQNWELSSFNQFVTQSFSGSGTEFIMNYDARMAVTGDNIILQNIEIYNASYLSEVPAVTIEGNTIQASGTSFSWDEALSYLDIEGILEQAVISLEEEEVPYNLNINQSGANGPITDLIINASRINLSGATNFIPRANRDFEINAGYIHLGQGTKIGASNSGSGGVHFHPMDQTRLVTYQQDFRNRLEEKLKVLQPAITPIENYTGMPVNTTNIDSLTSISNSQLNDVDNAFPNPFSNQLSIAIPKDFVGQRILVTIKNFTGSNSIQNEVEVAKSTLDIVPDMVASDQLSSGIYFITLQGEKVNRVYKVMKL